MEETVKQRIMRFLKEQKISQRSFEASIGQSHGYLNGLKKTPSALVMDKILTNYPSVNYTWLLTGEGSMLNDVKKEENNGKMQTLPLIPVDAMAGMLTGDSKTVMQYECENYVVPVFSHADFLIRVQGDSMTPKYESGDIVACKRVPLGGLWFQWGKTYVLDTSQGALIKRIEPSDQEGFVSIHSENPKYKPFDLPSEEIYGVALVVGVIRVE